MENVCILARSTDRAKTRLGPARRGFYGRRRRPVVVPRESRIGRAFLRAAAHRGRSSFVATCCDLALGCRPSGLCRSSRHRSERYRHDRCRLTCAAITTVCEGRRFATSRLDWPSSVFAQRVEPVAPGLRIAWRPPLFLPLVLVRVAWSSSLAPGRGRASASSAASASAPPVSPKIAVGDDDLFEPADDTGGGTGLAVAGGSDALMPPLSIGASRRDGSGGGGVTDVLIEPACAARVEPPRERGAPLIDALGGRRGQWRSPLFHYLLAHRSGRVERPP